MSAFPDFLGSHIFDHRDSTSLFFLANYYHENDTVISASVIVDDLSYDLYLESGNNLAGSWISVNMNLVTS
jgi:hypothetical protein